MQVRGGRLASIAAVTLLSLSLPGTSRAEEAGSGHYLPGAMASFMDALPGHPGPALVNFFLFYDASAGGGRQFRFGGLLAADLDATVYADTIGVLYETPFKLLGGEYAAMVALPYIWMEVEGAVTTPGGATARVRDTTNGIGDLMIYPFMLGWKGLGGDLKYDLRFGIYAPTGDYETGQLANAGKNYWSFEPGFLVSWISSKIGTEVSLYAGGHINTENDETDYKSGESIHLDGTIAQHLPLGPGFAGIGATGFVYEQVGGDSGDGAVLGDFKGHVEGVGPVVSYITKIGGNDLAAEVKWLHELGVEKRLEGDYIWAKLGFVFGHAPSPAPPAPPPPAEPVAKVVVTEEQIVTLEPIYFDFDRATIKPESFAVLDQVTKVMNERPQMKLRIEGHTDSKGREAHNRGLSAKRAQAVGDYLRRKAIAPERLEAIGQGPTRPIAPNQNPDGSDNPVGRAKNRRTEFHVVASQG